MTHSEKSLFELLADQEAITMQIADNSGMIDDALATAMDENELSVVTKIDGYKYAMDRLDGEAQVYAERARSFQQIADKLLAMKARIQARLKECMVAFDRKEAVGIDWRFVIAPARPRLNIMIDPSKLPEKYLTQTTVYVVDKDVLANDLKNGVRVVGAELVPSHMMRCYPAKTGKK